MDGERHRGRGARARIASAALLTGLALAPGAPAFASPPPLPTYMPAEMVHSILTPSQVGAVLGELNEYSINEALLQMPRFKKNGTIRLPASNEQMLGVWSAETQAYDAEHGTAIRAVAVFNGVPKEKGLDLEVPATRQRMLAAIEGVLETGIGGVQLDIEPYPTGPGFIALLEAVDGALARRGLAGRLSVVAPGDTGTWTPAYSRRIGELVGEFDPTYYDSESTSAGEYEQWIETGLAYETANIPSPTAIVPIIPSYGVDPWHIPAVEDIANASIALGASLAQGDRVDGAGIWWWYGFYEEEDHHHHFSSVADRAAWLEQTLALPFSP